MNSPQYFCNLKQAYLAITNTSKLSEIRTYRPSSLDAHGYYSLQLWVDMDGSVSNIKVVYILTRYQAERKWFAISEINAGIRGNFDSPFPVRYKYNKDTERPLVRYGVLL